jgi:hypothetical protein
VQKGTREISKSRNSKTIELIFTPNSNEREKRTGNAHTFILIIDVLE